MAKKITLEMFLRLREEHPFIWTWANPKEVPPNRVRRFPCGETKTEFYMRCGGCGTQHWLLWTELKKKRTASCRTCAKAPSLIEMREAGMRVGSSYVPSARWKMVKNRRYVLMQCTCGSQPRWVSWNRFQQGYATGCKSCKSALRTHGRGHTPLHVTWKDLQRRYGKDIAPEWRTFEGFERWAKLLYAPGWKLKRLDSSQPYGPDNCDYMPIKRKNPCLLIELSLPVGQQVLAAG